MLKALQEQVNAEMYSAYLYLSMSACCESMNLRGCANWIRVQAGEEMTHAMKIYDYIIERGGEMELRAIEKPPSTWDSPLDIFKQAYEHEVKVTGMINNLVNIAQEEKDHATNNMLQWFVSEQVEEEASADDIVRKLEMVGNDKRGLLMIDRDLAGRTSADDTEEA
jgi:ferritin